MELDNYFSLADYFYRTFTKLMQTILDELRNKEVKSVSLNGDPNNSAIICCIVFVVERDGVTDR